jgi:hypothetical protein
VPGDHADTLTVAHSLAKSRSDSVANSSADTLGSGSEKTLPGSLVPDAH